MSEKKPFLGNLIETKRDWYNTPLEEVIEKLETNTKKGLTSEDAKARLTLYGENMFEGENHIGILGKTLKQFKSPLVVVLLIAGVVTLVLHAFLDAIVIFAALIVNVAIGVFQEERASRAFEKLNASQVKMATVIRDERKVVIPAKLLVPGDIVLVESGMYVPADMRLIEARNLAINEAALTGEWVEVSKDAEVDFKEKKHVPLAEQSTMAWMGTLLAGGYGLGVVVSTGAETEVGKIAESLTAIKDRSTPIQDNIHRVARFLVAIITLVVLLIFGLGLFRGEPIGEMLLLAIAIAVAVVPEGLPAAVTVVLALGMERILKYGGLVKSLVAAETLGGTTTILTDKTGTLTEGKMRVSALYAHAGIKTTHADNTKVLETAILASDAFLHEDPEDNTKMCVEGRPIERAIVEEGIDKGTYNAQSLEVSNRVDFLSFESRRPFAASLNHIDDNYVLHASGSPEYLLEHSEYYYQDGKPVKLTDAIRKEFTELQEKESKEGKRFIGVAYKKVSFKKIPDTQKKEGLKGVLEDLIFVGFISFSDSIREDVPESIAKAQAAGARVIMMTGDNPATARKIAYDVGIIDDDYDVPVLRGTDVEELDDKELVQVLQKARIFARVLPKQKLRIARLLKNEGEVVAMTGDGINDAPALRSADIGIAVGSGTEVAKESADLILLNNSFSIIVYAIEEGRRILDNLKKIVAYLLSTGFGEIYLMIGALIIGGPIPMLPTQILWTNIVTGGLMSFAFAFEAKEEGIMERSPRESSAKNVLTPALRRMILIITGITGLFLIGLYVWLLSIGEPIEKIRTIMFVSVTLDSFLFIFALKNFHKPLWMINPFSNIFLLVSFFIGIALLLVTFALSPLRTLFSIELLNSFEVMVLVGVAIFNLLIIEITKYIFFHIGKNKD